jgi:hypothetical protein
MEFIYNDLEQKILPLIQESVEIKILTAFLKKSGLGFIKSMPHKKLSIISGIDFFITDPEAVYYLSENGFNVRIFYEPRKVFHPKIIYIRSNANKENLIVGSSNITFGGLNSNYEASLFIKKDFSTELVFQEFNKYFDTLQKSKYCINIENKIFIDYCEIFNLNKINAKDTFDNDIEKKYFRDEKPINNIDEIKRDDWIYHDKFGLGCIMERNEKIIDVFFMEKGEMKLTVSNMLQKIFSFDSALLDKYFSINRAVEFNSILNKFMEQKEESIKKRYIFYEKWKNYLSREMVSDEIYSFFEEASDFWTLMELKKNILSEDEKEFNSLLDILNNQNLSIYKRFELACNKKNENKVFGGIGPGITSTILSILYPDICIVYNNASNDFLNYFNIESIIKNNKTTNKYYQYLLFCKIIMEKYNFKNLIEVDCFIGYVKINYLRNEKMEVV